MGTFFHQYLLLEIYQEGIAELAVVCSNGCLDPLSMTGHLTPKRCVHYLSYKVAIVAVVPGFDRMRHMIGSSCGAIENGSASAAVGKSSTVPVGIQVLHKVCTVITTQ